MSVIWSFHVFFVTSLIKLSSKQLSYLWYETPWRPCDVTIMFVHRLVVHIVNFLRLDQAKFTMTSSNEKTFRVTGPLWSPVNYTKKGNCNAELWCFLWCVPKQTVEHTMYAPVIWDTTMSMWRHCNVLEILHAQAAATHCTVWVAKVWLATSSKLTNGSATTNATTGLYGYDSGNIGRSQRNGMIFVCSSLTHQGLDMAAISQTTFSTAFSWMKIYKFRLRFHWSLFQRVQLTI